MPRNLNLGLGIDFSPTLQEGFISGRGVDMIHEIGLACTCRVSDVYSSTLDDGKKNRQDPFCPKCGKDGWLFRSPVLLRGIFTNARYQNNIMDAGNYMPGDALFSPSQSAGNCGSGDRRVGTYDKLTATWAEPLDDGHVIVRGAGSRATAEGVKTALSDDEDRLWYEPANSIWCEDEYGIVYEENADFVLGPGKIIKWVGGRPDEGVVYTIKYNAYFEWIVWQPPGERRDRDGINLGEIVYLRKRHVQIVNDSPHATSLDKVSLQAAIKC